MFFFDMDDTLFNTDAWLASKLRLYGYKHKEKREQYFLDSRIPKAIKDTIFNDAAFMLYAPECSGFDVFVDAYRAGVAAICTHRGYHKHGAHYTAQQLCRALALRGVMTTVSELMPRIHAIASAQWPDKLEYLDTVCSTPYFLVDDNPKSAKSALGTTILVDKPWNRNIEVQNRIPDLHALRKIVARNAKPQC